MPVRHEESKPPRITQGYLVRRARLGAIPLTLCLGFAALTAQAAIIPRLSNGENLKIAAIGTSLTNTNWSSWFERTGVWLNGLPYTGKVTLDNEAIGGSYSQSGIDVQLPNALANNPDAIFIEFAINDAYTPYSVTQQKSKENLQAMITTINNWGTAHGKTVDIVVQAMNNVADINGWTGATDRPNLDLYYGGYGQVATTNHLLLIDNYPNWVNLYNSQGDHATWLSYVDIYGIHPNQLGTENVILPEVQRALLSQVPEPSAIVLLAAALVAVLAGLFFYAWRRLSRIAALVGLAVTCTIPNVMAAERPATPAAEKKLTKLPGVIGNLVLESTPLLYRGRPIMFHSRRPMDTSQRTEVFLILTDVESGKEIARFGQGHSLGCAFVEGDTIHVFATEQPASAAWFRDIQHFWSSDLKTWKRELAIAREPGEKALLNSSVCRDEQGYLMAYESGQPVKWCFKFARSKDLSKWEKVPGLVFAGMGGKEFSACPVVRYFKPYYYVIYTPEGSPDHNSWVSCVTRSKDLETWQLSPKNPVLKAIPGEGTNNSDVDLIEIDGKTYVYYFTGNQQDWGDLKRAVYPGPMLEFFESYFPQGSKPVEISARTK